MIARSQIQGWSGSAVADTRASSANSANSNNPNTNTNTNNTNNTNSNANNTNNTNTNNNNNNINNKKSKAERRKQLVAQRKQPPKQTGPQTAPPPSAPQTKTKSKAAPSKQLALFSHLAAYHRDSKLPDAIKRDMDAKHQDLHPAIVRLGLLYQHYKIVGSNQRCIALLDAFKQIIHDYATPPNTVLCRHLDAYLKPQINYLVSTRPLSVSMGNAIRFIKCEIAAIPPDMPEDDAKELLNEKITNFIRDRITCAATVIVDLALQKVRDGDVILVYSSSSLTRELLLRAHENDIDFRVIIVDSRPLFEGKKLMKELVAAGVHCTFAHLSAISYVMKDATKVFLGIHALLSNGFVMSRAGTSTVATMAYSSGVPVIGLCETYKFSDRVQLDSFVNNELGDPDDLIETYSYPSSLSNTILQVDSISPDPSTTTSKKESTKPSHPSSQQTHTHTNPILKSWRNIPSLKLLNLMYDVTPSDFITIVITEVGMIPCSSVPVVLREGVKVNGGAVRNSGYKYVTERE